jgi:hypothetical protein
MTLLSQHGLVKNVDDLYYQTLLRKTRKLVGIADHRVINLVSD